jgi:DNA-binding NarL/FixJ family response regulator
MNAEKSIIENCIQYGANGYLSKDSAPDELMEALTEVQRGEVYYSRAVLKALAGLRTTRLATKTLQVDLSARETEILKLICDGLSPKEIADKLFLSKRTVDTHKTNIMQKFDVGSVGKLISIALQNNLLK